MTLGDLIDTVGRFRDQFPDSKIVMWDNNGDECGFGEPCSWRGSYDELSIPPGTREFDVKQFYQFLVNECLNKTFHGWKGGEFLMHSGVGVWADPEGTYREHGITHVMMDSYGVVNVFVEKCEY